MKAFKKTKKAFDSAKFYKENGINAEIQKRLNFLYNIQKLQEESIVCVIEYEAKFYGGYKGIQMKQFQLRYLHQAYFKLNI